MSFKKRGNIIALGKYTTSKIMQNKVEKVNKEKHREFTAYKEKDGWRHVTTACDEKGCWRPKFEILEGKDGIIYPWD